MKEVLYHLIINIGAAIMLFLGRVQHLIAICAQNLGRFIAPQEAEYTEAVTLQMEALEELNILKAILEVRDDAVAEDDWTAEHRTKLHMMVNILAERHDWGQRDVDRYIGQLVESGPEGYAYQPVGDDEIEDDEDDDLDFYLDFG